MPNYKLLIEYDGSRFWGWQVQPNLRTVQGEIENALLTFLQQPVRLSSAGRTDRGVHASGQVANFRIAREVEEPRLLRALQGLTGNDIVIHSVERVDDNFHARFDAVARCYRYHLNFRPLAIGRQYSFYFARPLDLAPMKEAAHCLLGEHQFEAFSHKSAADEHYLCHVDSIEWLEDGDRLVFRVRANRFVHGMVRRIIGTLITVGLGRLSVAEFARILASQNRNHPGMKAPAHGLVLEKVYY